MAETPSKAGKDLGKRLEKLKSKGDKLKAKYKDAPYAETVKVEDKEVVKRPKASIRKSLRKIRHKVSRTRALLKAAK